MTYGGSGIGGRTRALLRVLLPSAARGAMAASWCWDCRATSRVVCWSVITEAGKAIREKDWKKMMGHEGCVLCSLCCMCKVEKVGVVVTAE